MPARFRMEPLGAAHDRAAFSSGVDALDRYLKTQATQDIRRRVSNCFVATPMGETTRIAGFYTLAATSIPIHDLSDDEVRKLPRYPVLPAALIGRLAVDRVFRGKQLGAALLVDALERASKAEPAVLTVIVDAKDEEAAAFYRHHGFRAFGDMPARLYLPVATATRLLR